MREKNTETNCITEVKIAIKTVTGHQLCTVFKDIQCKFFPVGQRHYAHSNVGFMYFFFKSGIYYLCSSCRWLRTHTLTATYGQAPQLSGSPSPLEVGPFHWGLPGAPPLPLGGCCSLKQLLWSHPELRCFLTLMHPLLQRSPPSEPTHHPETKVPGK